MSTVIKHIVSRFTETAYDIIAALACIAAIACLVSWLASCKAFSAAAPTLLDVTQRVIESELEQAKDAEKSQRLREALMLVEEARKAQHAAEEAARRAENAANEAQDAAALAKAYKEAAHAEQRSIRVRLMLADALRAGSSVQTE